MEKAFECFTTNYANFSGRACRSEYWFFILLMFIASFVLMITDLIGGTYHAKLGYGLFGGIFYLATVIPSLSVSVRRMHDLDKTGWWLLLSLIPIIGSIWLFILYCTKGTEGNNRFGSDPLQQYGY